MNEEVEVVANEKQKQTSSKSQRERERERETKKKKGRREKVIGRKKMVTNTEHEQFGKIVVVSVVLFFCSVLCKTKTERSTLLCVPENRTGTFNSVLVVAVGGDDGFFFPRNFQIFPMSWRRNLLFQYS